MAETTDGQWGAGQPLSLELTRQDVFDRLTVALSFQPDDAQGMELTFDHAATISKAKLDEAGQRQLAGENGEALDRALEAAVLSSRQPANWRAVADAAIRTGQLWLADVASRKAVLVEPRYAPGHAVRAEALVMQGRTGPAMAHALAAIENSSVILSEATDVVARCRRAQNEIRPDGCGDLAEVARHAVARGYRDSAIAAFAKAAARSHDEPLERILLELCLDAALRSDVPDGQPRFAISDRPKPFPLVLVSQIQRSGGTLLTQLFDGHPQLFVHPHELQIGHPQKWNWPQFDLEASTKEWLATLYERNLTRLLVGGGYAKSDRNTYALHDRKPFDFSIEELSIAFCRLADGARSPREILNAYLTAFFATWRNIRSSGKENWFLGFCPRLTLYKDSIEGFFSDYPDGRLISCIRDPISWYASSVRHDDEYSSLDRAMHLWRASTQSALTLAEARPGQVYLVTYDELVLRTRAVMKRLTGVLEISFDEILLTPTYASLPILPNSSFQINTYGVHRKSLNQEALLRPEDLREIKRQAYPLYERALEQIERGGRPKRRQRRQEESVRSSRVD